MFSYYGSKSKIINKYPSPKFDKIIEPFAGSARYALKWWDRDVLLVDLYLVIIEIWHYLQAASKQDIMGLPEPNWKIYDKRADWRVNGNPEKYYKVFPEGNLDEQEERINGE